MTYIDPFHSVKGTLVNENKALTPLDANAPSFSNDRCVCGEFRFHRSTNAEPTQRNSPFLIREIDGTPWLDDSYRLRYRVYCLERNYLKASDYPDQRETDDYDSQSVHMGMFDNRNNMVGTFRLVLPEPLAPPLFHHCAINISARSCVEKPAPEVSRFVLDTEQPTPQSDPQETSAICNTDRNPRKEPGPVMYLLRAVYDLCKRRGFSKFHMATDRFFSRLLNRYGVPHTIIGPTTDYQGLVRPFTIDLDEGERSYTLRDPQRLKWWQDGLGAIGTPC